MQNSIQPAINLKRFLGEIPRFFQNKEAFIDELVQNSFRSGATRIEIGVTEGTFSITDNGHGVSEMQDLLTLAESGWKSDEVMKMDPAGLGIYSAFLVSENSSVVTWRSRGKQRMSKAVIFSKKDLLSGKSIAVVENVRIPNDSVSGTQISLNTGFELTQCVEAVRRLVRYYDRSLDGRPLEVILNNEPLPQMDYLAEDEKKPVFIKEISAGRLAFYTSYFRSSSSHYDSNSLFMGKEIPIPSECGLHFRIRVKPGGLTPRLPDRSSYVSDHKLEELHREIALCAAEYLSTAGAISVNLAMKYFPALADQFVPSDIREFDLSGALSTAAYPYAENPDSVVQRHPHLQGDRLEELKKFDIVIPGIDRCDTESVGILSGLYQIQNFRVGVVDESCARFCKHPEFVKRLRFTADLSLSIKKGRKSVRAGDLTFQVAKMALKDKTTNSEYQLSGIVPTIEFESQNFGDMRKIWVTLEYFPTAKVISTLIDRMKDLCSLVHYIDEEDTREDPYLEDFDYYVADPLIETFAPATKILSALQRSLFAAVKARYDDEIEYKGITFLITNGNDMTFSAYSEKFSYRYENGALTQAKR